MIYIIMKKFNVSIKITKKLLKTIDKQKYWYYYLDNK